MARPPRFSDDDILDGTARALLERGPAVTIADVAKAIDGPSGSIYHRFSSRDELLGRLWIRSIRRFHTGLLAALRDPDPEVAIASAARHIPAFCRAHPAEARAMLLFSQRRLLTDGPAALRPAVESINEEVESAMEHLADRLPRLPRERAAEVLMIATQLTPYGITRAFIGRDMPAWIEDGVVAAARAIVDLHGDEASRPGADLTERPSTGHAR